MLLAPLCALGGDILVNTFGGLNTQDNPAALQPYQAQDLLNVNLQPGMKSVFKRDGYGLFQTMPAISTAPIHGGYHFQQTGGADVQLWGSDKNLYASVSDATFVQIATGTVAATWQCTDNLGFAYCLTSSNDTAVKTDGTSTNTSYQGAIPLGSIVASTPLQLLVAGVSGALSTIYVSANNNFTNFTTGPLATDPYTEIINAPGSRITHLAYYFGKVFWWKDQSFGYLSGSSSQNTVSVTIVSNQIGTLDNSSAYWNPTVYEGPNSFSSGAQAGTSGNPYFNEMGQLGGIFFRGQDNHVYQYDGYTLTRLSRIITPTVGAANRRKSNSWAQTTQTDLQAGSIVPTANLSTTISAGDVIVSSFSVSENSSSQWNNGTASNVTINATNMRLATNNSGNIDNANFETGSGLTNWSTSGSAWNTSVGGTVAGTHCSFSAHTGSNFWYASLGGISTVTGGITDLSGTFLDSTPISDVNNSCTWQQRTLTVTATNIGRRVKFKFRNDSDGSILVNSDPFILGGNITFWTASDCNGASCAVDNFGVDDVTSGSSTITSGSFTSQIFNTGFTSSTIQASVFSQSINTSSSSLVVQTSTAATTAFRDLFSITNGATSSSNYVGNQYLRYISSMSVTASDSALSTVNRITLISASTGTYYSAVNNAPSLTSWGNLAIDDFVNGASTITYFVRASTGSFTVLSSTPLWSASQTKNSIVNYSTGTYMQMKANFSLTAATETPTLNDFQFNWFEGNAGDKAYITYFQDAIWLSVSSGTSTTNNEILYLDLLNNAWLKYDIAANGFAVENNALYIGSPASAKIFKFGSGAQTDNGNSINSYWKSKDFTGQDPSVQNEFQQADFTFAEALSTATYTYLLDQNVSTSVSLPLFSSTASIVKRGLLLPIGKIGTFYNFQVGDNSSNPKWTLMMHKVRYNPLNWRPQGS